MDTGFSHNSDEKYGYRAPDGRYRVDQWLLSQEIIFQRKIGYARVEDAKAEAAALRRLVDDNQLLAQRRKLYICSDLSALEGVTRGARPIVAGLFEDEEIEVVIAACGVSPFTRILDRIFQSWRPTLRHHYFGTLSDAERFLIEQCRIDSEEYGETVSSLGNEGHSGRLARADRDFDGVVVSVFSPPHWSYTTQDDNLSVTYSLVHDDILLIEMAGVMETAEQMFAAQTVAQTVLGEVKAEQLYVIRDSRRITRVSMAARRAYLEYAKDASSRELLVLHIGTTLSRMLLRSVKVIAPQTFGKWHSAVTTLEALDKIQKYRQEHRQNQVSVQPEDDPNVDGQAVNTDSPTDETIIPRLVDRLVRMAWDVTFRPAPIELAVGHPYEELIAALDVLQRDLSEVFLTQESHLEEIKRSRERLKQAQVIAHLGSWEWNLESERVFWSEETYRMFGYEPGSVDPSYELYLEHLHPDSRERAVVSMEEALACDGSFENKFTIVRTDGVERVCRFHGRAERNSETGTQTVRATFIDVTDLMKAKEEAEHATTTLQRSEDALRKHLAAMSHDVRTPLTSLKLGLNRLMMGGSPDEIGPALRAEVEHLDTLFANMLSLARLRTGIDETEVISCDLMELLERIQIRLTVLARDQGVRVAIAEPSQEVVLNIEALAMEQAFTNLVHNAIKFAQENVAILIDVEEGWAVITIRDDGVSAQSEERLVDLNDEGLTGIADLRKGLGLGFAIAKAIVGKHSGSLTINPHPELGTQVVVKLPIKL